MTDNFDKLFDKIFQGCPVCGGDHECCLCEYCTIHDIHSGPKHGYTHDSCWRCRT